MSWEEWEMYFELAAACLLGGLSLIDIWKKQIPVLLPIILGGLGIFVRGPELIGQTLAGMLPGALLLVVSLVSGGCIGLGDGIVLLFIGAILGGLTSLHVFMGSFCLIFVFSCIGLILKKMQRKSTLPFIPFYFISYLVVIYL